MADDVTSPPDVATPTIGDVPPAIRAAAGDVSWTRLGGGNVGSAVFRGHRADGAVVFLKAAAPVGPSDGAALLQQEHERLQWFAGRLPVPQVLQWAVDDAGRGFLLTTALAGSPAVDREHRGDAEALIRALADGLRTIHALPVDECPYDGRLTVRLGHARQRVEAGLVDQRDFELPYQRYTPARLLELLEQSRPRGEEDLVVTHGDCSFENILLEKGRAVGFVDVGRAGVADRYLDLAIMATNLATHVSPHALGPFFDAYGIELPDVVKLDFYVMLDEFF
jgi:aminoglycoside phosphotransferase